MDEYKYACVCKCIVYVYVCSAQKAFRQDLSGAVDCKGNKTVSPAI